MLKKYRIQDIDFKLIVMVIILGIIGIIVVGSADSSLQPRQIAGVIMGVILMLIIALIDYTKYLKLSWIMYIGNLILLAMVEFTSLGDSGGGAQRWLEIPIINFRFQPSEITKIVLILFFAQFIMKHKEKVSSFKFIAISTFLFAVPWVLIYLQPDLSTGILIAVLFCGIMYIGGLKFKIILGIIAVAIPLFLGFLYLILQPDQEILLDYQVNRILSFKDPEKYQTDGSLQQYNSIMAIGSGQLYGKGYMSNEITSVKSGDYLSAEETDFIFAVIGEEFGFIGSCAVIFLLTAVAVECIIVAMKSKFLSGKIIASSLGVLIMIQSFFNIGVATFILPNTGIPLPFISSGLTSLISLFISMGIVLNIRLQCKKTIDKDVV